MLRIITLLIGFLDDWIKKVERTLQSNAKCDLINQFNGKINFCNQDPFCQETRVLLLGVLPLIRCEVPFPQELVGSEYFDVFLMHLLIDICGYLLSAQKRLCFKFSHCLILQYYFSPCQKTHALIQSAENSNETILKVTLSMCQNSTPKHQETNTNNSCNFWEENARSHRSFLTRS